MDSKEMGRLGLGIVAALVACLALAGTAGAAAKRMNTHPKGGGWSTFIDEEPLTGEENFTDETGPGELQRIQLDRTTMAVTEYVRFPDPGREICKELLEEAASEPDTQMTIIAGYCAGAEAPGFTAIYGGKHLLVENAGHDVGVGAGGVTGNLRRSVGLDNVDYFRFVDPETTEFDTYEEASGAHYTNVGGHRTPISLEPHASGGIVITALDPALERMPELSHTYSLNEETEGDATELQAAAELLGQIAKEDEGAL